VPRTGFEPAHPCERCDLNAVHSSNKKDSTYRRVFSVPRSESGSNQLMQDIERIINF